MGRIRTIKPELPHSEKLGSVSRDARLSLILLLTLADDSGRTRGAFAYLSGQLFPYDSDAAEKIGGWLKELDKIGSIVVYELDGSKYIEITNWLQHQKIDKPTKSRIPAFDEGSPRCRRVFAEHSSLDLGPKDLGPKELDRDQGPKDQGTQVEKVETDPESKPDPPAKKKSPSANSSVKFDPCSIELPVELRTPDFETAWAEWIVYRLNLKAKALQPDSWRLQLATLATWGPQAAAAAIRESKRNGWTGLFPPKPAAMPMRPTQVIPGSTLDKWGTNHDEG